MSEDEGKLLQICLDGKRESKKEGPPRRRCKFLAERCADKCFDRLKLLNPSERI
jgi:hypothetical protein